MIIPFSWQAARPDCVELMLSLKLLELTPNRRISTVGTPT